jgi:carbon-monoxide dehydrogenase large subunit
MEPRSVVAAFDPATGRYRLEMGTQSPHRMATDLAPALGVPAAAIRVVAHDCGGSFGMKNAGYGEYVVALWAAKQVGRPVRWTASRLESFQADAHGRDQWVDAALALDAEGNFLALKVHMVANLGAVVGPATPHSPTGNVGGLSGVYRTPKIHVAVDGVLTNTQHTATYRGAGRPEATYVIERMIDIAAAELGIDRIALRRRNLVTASEMPFKTALTFTYDCGDFPKMLDRAVEAGDVAGFPARRAASLARGRRRGLGISNPIEIAGGPAPKPSPEFAQLELQPSGAARLVVGSSDAGQGHATVFRQMLADRLGLPVDGMEIVTGDTDAVAKGTGTFGSRTMSAAGAAIWWAMDQLIERLRAKAADVLEVAAADLVFEERAFKVAGTDRTIPFVDVLARERESVAAEVFESTHGPTFPNGCHLCEVEVDPDTGHVDVVRYLVVDDVGTVINPLLVKGQIAGGVTQGLGQALMENAVYEEHSGQLLSATFMDYAMPRAQDVPSFSIESEPVPTRENPLGAKGVGEAGTVGALAAVMSAVCDAIGVRHLDMPATPERVWRALHADGDSASVPGESRSGDGGASQ